jgi:hypothetical protein
MRASGSQRQVAPSPGSGSSGAATAGAHLAKPVRMAITTAPALTSLAILALVGACDLGAIGDDEPPTIDTEAGSEVPLDDADLQYILREGFGGLPFAQRCVSRQEGGPTIDVEPLPVGGDRTLECLTSGDLDEQTLMVQSGLPDPTTGETVPWCVLGALRSTTPPEGPPGLELAIVDRPTGAPWRIVATHPWNDQILISRASFQGILVWPIHFGASYATTRMEPADGFATDCDAVFGR